jgi:UDPglucose 6-dehydrogenase
MNIAVIGTGYVGLVTGVGFAETGNKVVCVDNDPEKLRMFAAGEIPIYEPGLKPLFDRNVKEGRLSFTQELKKAVDFARVIFLALPTPPTEDGSADLQYVLRVAEDIAGMMTEFKLLVNKSTVPVGTADKVRALVASKTSVEFDVASNPEFLREGEAVADFMKPERVVIGCASERAREMLTELYKPFIRSGNPVIFMDVRSAEITKYAANAFLATKISFMNEISRLCEAAGANVDMVRLGIGSDSRIGKRFIFAGVGYGGSCFPKDVKALVHTAREFQRPMEILEAVMRVNESQKSGFIQKIFDFYRGDVQGKTFALWGLAFKPNTDDVREAPALEVIEKLTRAGAAVAAFDPEAMETVKKYYPHMTLRFAADAYDALVGADALIIVTEWGEFRNPDFDRIGQTLKQKVVFDGRNVYELEVMRKHGFYYQSIGRPTVVPQ